MPIAFAEQLTAAGFADAIDHDTVGVLAVAAIEPHGPHLPLSTDCDIARGHLGALAQVELPAQALVLPLQTIGYSAEHSGQPGVFSHEPELLLALWLDVVRPFHAAGGRRLIVLSSHGGNSETVGLLVTRLRTTLGMLAVSASWLRFGQPNGLYTEAELHYGIHGGDVETSLMLHYRPDLVRMAEARDFRSAAADWDRDTSALKVHGRIRPGWRTTDLNAAGAVGDARAATAAKGAASAAHAVRDMAGLIGEVAAFDLGRLGGVP